jgi:hypothetical protein
MISGSAILDTARPRDPENMISWKISHLGAGPVPLMELVTLGGGEFPSKSILGNSAHRAGIPSGSPAFCYATRHHYPVVTRKPPSRSRRVMLYKSVL